MTDSLFTFDAHRFALLFVEVSLKFLPDLTKLPMLVTIMSHYGFLPIRIDSVMISVIEFLIENSKTALTTWNVRRECNHRGVQNH